MYVFDKWVELILYPNVLYRFGNGYGSLIMIAFSLLVCLILLYLYDHIPSGKWRDVFGFESMKEAGAKMRRSLFHHVTVPNGSGLIGGVLHYEAQAREELRRVIARLLISRRRIRTVLFFFLSCQYDPMTALVFLRPAHDHTMGRREWRIFLASVVVSNVWWTLVVAFALEFLGRYAPWSLRVLTAFDPWVWGVAIYRGIQHLVGVA